MQAQDNQEELLNCQSNITKDILEDESLNCFACDQCEYKVVGRVSVKIHYNSLEKDMIYDCYICGYVK